MATENNNLKLNKNSKILDEIENENMNHDDILRILENVIRDLNYKIISERINDQKKTEIKIKQTRTLVYLCKTYVEIKDSSKIEELAREIEMLKTCLYGS